MRISQFRRFLVLIAASFPCAAALLPANVQLVLTTMPPYYAGKAVNFKATVSATDGIPGGTVTFAIDSVNTAPSLVDPASGAATFAWTALTGNHTISASYSGDSNHQPATTDIQRIQVNPATTSLSLSCDSATVAQTTSIKASVSLLSQGAATLGGTVDFSAGGHPIQGCSSLVLQSGVATCKTVFAQSGIVSVVADYRGDVNTAPSEGSLNINVGLTAPRLIFSVSNNAATYPQPVTIAATVLGVDGMPNPTGTVTFFDNGSKLGSAAVDNTGQARITLPSTGVAPLPAGNHSINVTYSGDANYATASGSSPASLVVSKALPSLVLSPGTAPLAQPVKLTVQVLPLIPTGTVDFWLGSSLIPGCSAVPLQNGIATCNTSFGQLGVQNIGATYSGDANDNTGMAAEELIVVKCSPSVYVAADPPAPASGVPFILGALVLGSAGVPAPTGTITISDGATTLGSALKIGADGHAGVQVPSLSTGTHAITATYSGDSNYLTATGTLSLTIGKGGTTVTLTASASTVAPGQNVTFTAKVTPTTAGGTVDFSNGTAAMPNCTALPLQNGAVSCTTNFPQPGSLTITATYSGDGNNGTGSSSVPLVVTKAASSLAVTASPSNAAVGQSVTLSAMLTPAGAAGTITLTAGTTALPNCAALIPQSGSVTCTATFQQPGTYTITATYTGDPNTASSTGTAQLVVGKAAAGVTVSAAPSTASTGQSVTLTATVTPSSATGTVSFTNGAAPIANCSAIALQSGSAVCTTSFSQAGNVTINASYGGDSNNAATTGTAQLAITKPSSTVTLSTAPSSVTVWQSVTITATVTPAGAGGTVSFSNGSAVIASCGAIALQNATATCTTSFSQVGSVTITASYSGDSNTVASSGTLPLMVAKASPTVTLNVANPSVAPGQSIVLTATVTPALATGTVSFTNGTTALANCSSVPLQNSTATCTTTFPQTGNATITATYSGDANTTSATGSVQLSVTKSAATMTVATAPATPVYGAAVLITAAVPAPAGSPAATGNVTFTDGSSTLATVPLASDGTALLTVPSSNIPALTAGTHVISAAYAGDSRYAAANAAPASVTVAKAGTSTSLSASNGTAFTATVAVNAPGAGTPTGSVQFYNASAQIGSAQLSLQNGSLVATLPRNAQAGTITATYTGDANFSSSTSAPVTIAAPKAQLILSSSRNPAMAGQPIAFTAYIAPAPGVAPPSGTVQFSSDGTALAGATLVSGAATTTTSALSVGTHSIVASYTGDANYSAATATLSQVVNRGTVSLSLSVTPPAAMVGQPVTLIATTNPPIAGQIQFTDGSSSLGSIALSAGSATLVLKNLASGSHALQAVWAGDANWSAADSLVGLEVIERFPTTTALTISGTTLIATVTAQMAGGGAPTGSVNFTDPGTNAVLATVTLSGGAASTPLPPPTQPVMAVYSGDGLCQPSASTPLAQLAVTNAASYALGAVAPDEIVSLFGTGLENSAAVKITDSAGTGSTAQLLFTSQGQASAVLPSNLAPGDATISVVTAAGSSVSATVTITGTAPGIFTYDASGQGLPAAQTIHIHADGAQDSPQNVGVFDPVRKIWAPAPIDLSDTSGKVLLVLYVTGIRHHSALPDCIIGGKPGSVIYAGAQNSFPGLDQVNVILPASLKGAGKVNLSLTADGAVSNSVTLVFQ